MMTSPIERAARPCRGFSFAEVLIGLVLLVLAILPLYSLLLAAFSGTAASVTHARAFGLARSVVDVAAALPLDELTQERAEAIARDVAAGEAAGGLDAPAEAGGTAGMTGAPPAAPPALRARSGERDLAVAARVVAPDRVVPLAGLPGRSMRYRQLVVEVTWSRGADPRRELAAESRLALSTVRTRME